jgi:hypothetical protein
MPHNVPRFVVQNATVADDKPAPRERHDIAERRDPILQGHPIWSGGLGVSEDRQALKLWMSLRFGGRG